MKRRSIMWWLLPLVSVQINRGLAMLHIYLQGMDALILFNDMGYPTTSGRVADRLKNSND
ncbi:hypothetical protein [Sphingobacterium thalpophilum]|uniref:hypothetical protein n=1 Tax=Sphingobacterium thalpophilum TaxID=259 RepID=UPI002D798934|nr:hypothetical protein [Sphingobacterium thalpophilum]